LAQAYFRKWFIEDASDKWEEIPLGQLFVISSGKGLKKEKFTEHGQYRVLGANGEIGKTNEYLFNERLMIRQASCRTVGPARRRLARKYVFKI
jgi:type I restriction enzyme S subunit